MGTGKPAGRKLDVCVVLLDDGYASTALMPIEVFHSAGALWRELKGEDPEPRFRVTTASIGGKPIRSPYGGMSMTPEKAIEDVERHRRERDTARCTAALEALRAAAVDVHEGRAIGSVMAALVAAADADATLGEMQTVLHAVFGRNK